MDYNNINPHKNLKHEYLMLTDIDYRIKHSKNDDYKYCLNCNLPRLNIQNGCFVCTKCGETEYLLTDIIDYNDKRGFKKYTPYNRVCHLKEILKQFQAMETKKVPDDVILLITTRIDEMQMSHEKCSMGVIYDIMKSYKLQKYYKNIPQIHGYITDKEPMYIPQKTEQLIIHMFKKVEHKYKQLSNNKRNFLNYSYVLRKLFNMIKMYDIANCFHLLKSEKHLKEHDKIFSQICERLNWKFSLL
jgi:uncharacterized protein (UPF0297 family)